MQISLNFIAVTFTVGCGFMLIFSVPLAIIVQTRPNPPEIS